MPLLTPTRALVVLTSFLLVSFLWTWGLPHQYAAPTLPIVNHDKGEEKPIAGQLLPEPLIANVGAEGAKNEKATPTTLVTEMKPGPTRSADIGSDKNCKDVRGASDVMIVIRTSRAEVEKPPAHLVKLLACAHHFLIFSDHEGEIDGHPIHDALDIIPNTTRSNHEEFLEYEKMKADKKYKPSTEKAKALDKWKWLPMVYKVATMAPNHRFYMFIEPETSLSWTNLLQWLDRLDYRIPYYSGVPDTVDDKRYAQRSPGIMLSYGALQQYWPRHEELYATEWEPLAATESRGSLILATAMKQAHVEFYSSFGLLDPETPSSLIWGQKFWCTPVVSWHGLTSTQADSLWDTQEAWTKKHGWATPYTHYNAFEQFVKPHLAEQKEDWDNVSSDTQLTAESGRREKLAKQKAEGKAEGTIEHQVPKDPPKDASKNTKPFPKRDDSLDTLFQVAADSPENCKATCQKTDDCLQWKYTPAGDGACHLGKSLRLGAKVNPDAKGKWTSGWMLDRVNRITEEWGRCERAEWRFNQ
ncbi:uncharacterized protein N0V89_007959 [Didymosphaeria variabile]|uniref:Glycosyltransferase family 31 protein n=1 Tax=Didymosphaeria variabile TaxID=1932322 RepID=A0A9W8XFE2_9PLEO|nr:uncharacterized protein N0V89_007959 [Didymosphaeria variabile]KAJ4349345.1 hypothetical protein N0V89_007959 [Didymosphaeria variabile]